MNAHVKSAHKGHRWVCNHEECSQECTSKASLKRHIERKHLGPLNKILCERKGSGKRKLSIDLAEREYFGDDELTEGAKIAKIRRLENELKAKEIEIQTLKEENDELKAGQNDEGK